MAGAVAVFLLQSGAAAEIAPPAFDPDDSPRLHGFAQEGNMLTCIQGTIIFFSAGDEMRISWLRKTQDGAVEVIAGEEDNSYAPAPQDIGLSIACEVSVANSAGAVSARSEFAGPVSAADVAPDVAPVNLTLPAVTGKIQMGWWPECQQGVWSHLSGWQETIVEWIVKDHPEDEGGEVRKTNSIVSPLRKKDIGRYYVCRSVVYDRNEDRRVATAESAAVGPVGKSLRLGMQSKLSCRRSGCELKLTLLPPEVSSPLIGVGFQVNRVGRNGNQRPIKDAWLIPSADGSVVIPLQRRLNGIRYYVLLSVVNSDFGAWFATRTIEPTKSGKWIVKK